MTSPAAADGPGKVPALLAYQFVCLAGLVLLLLALVGQGSGFLGLLVAAAGLLGVLSRLRIAPVLLLLVLATALYVQQIVRGGTGWHGQNQSFRASDLALCCGALAYVAGHYRLQGLADHLLPLDRRDREEGGRRGLLRLWRPRPVRRQRSAALVTPGELSLFFLMLPVPALVAQGCWGWLSAERTFLEIPAPLARCLLTVWVVLLGGIVAAALLRHWRTRAMTPQEAAVLLQDVVWRETRGEQRRLQRWLTWTKLRRSK